MQPSLIFLLLLSSVFIVKTSAKPWDVKVLLQWRRESLEETIHDLKNQNSTTTASTSAVSSTTPKSTTESDELILDLL
ncbi:hypothetical protein PRIPAC_71148 [Pristionchus pacificus]|uniref:Uncharacterized protein n=1 Tax=Pristionchus pacificus TaxID=54126 RepID=A0A454XW95_PRIPA|nr:hypothetical protein PRIPAC_71148 [Pristionchus pacificus]|eukprot:PDM64491.1 hypothetical protein PRIPAC_52747 [Pristionchus pacificus]